MLLFAALKSSTASLAKFNCSWPIDAAPPVRGAMTAMEPPHTGASAGADAAADAAGALAAAAELSVLVDPPAQPDATMAKAARPPMPSARRFFI